MVTRNKVSVKDFANFPIIAILVVNIVKLMIIWYFSLGIYWEKLIV